MLSAAYTGQRSFTVTETADPVNMERNLAWADEPIDEQLLADVEAVLAPVRDLTWLTGRPENADTAGDPA